MRALARHLKYRLIAGMVLAMTGNSSAATSANDRDVQNFKPFSLFGTQVTKATVTPMRPQTTANRNSFSSPGNSTVMAPILFTRINQSGSQAPPAPSPLTPPAPAPPSSIAAPAPQVTSPFPATPPPSFSQPTTIPPVNSVDSTPRPSAPSAPIAEPRHETAATTTVPGVCLKCGQGIHQEAPPQFDNHAAGLEAGQYHTPQEKCYSQELLKAAKRNVAGKPFYNRPKSGGWCAYGVRTSINAAGIYGSNLGNAVDYQIYGKAGAIGMKNYISEYGDDMSKIPPGAVLVFAGPNTSEYMRTGYEGPSGSKGNWLGHVTIKGDDGKYYTDARTDQPAVGWPNNRSARKLVGVYIMHQCTQACSQALKNKCG